MPGKKPLTEGKGADYAHPPADVLAGLGVGPEDWDVLVVGDGSGSGWNAACGWASVLVDRHLGLRKTFFGAMNAGTSYLAELVPYVQAIAWYADGPGKARLADARARHRVAAVRVHVVTDNNAVAQQGGAPGTARKAGHYYWKMIEAFEAHGYDIRWHWVGRSRVGLNRLCDYMAGMCRKAIDAVAPLTPPVGTSAYDYNPDAPAPQPPAPE